MSDTLDTLSQDALVLPPDQRLTLAYRLLTSVESAADPVIEAAQEAEIARRIAQFDAGEMEAIPAEKVFARLREITAKK